MLHRAELLPVKKQHKEVMEKLYALPDSVPFEASSLYFDLSKEIVDFDLDDKLYKE